MNPNTKKIIMKKLETIDASNEKIQELTNFLKEYQKSASIAVEAIFEQFKKVEGEQKIALIFLTDSILKKCRPSYQEPIEKAIDEIFLAAYKSCPEQRKTLLVTYHTWEPIFSAKTMNTIYWKVKTATNDDLQTKVTVDDLDNLIQYFKSEKLDHTHLELKKEALIKAKEEKRRLKEAKNRAEGQQAQHPMMQPNPGMSQQMPKKLVNSQMMQPIQMLPPNMMPQQMNQMRLQLPQYNMQQMQPGYKIPKKNKSDDDYERIDKKFKMENQPINMHNQQAMMANQYVHAQGYPSQIPMDPRLNRGGMNVQRGYAPQMGQTSPNEEAHFSDDEGNQPYDIQPSDQQFQAPPKQQLKSILDIFKQKKNPTTSAPQMNQTFSHPQPHTPNKQIEMVPEMVPLALSARKSSEFLDQACCLLFKMLLQKKKVDLPRCIKTKYAGKNTKVEPLSLMISQRDLKVIDMLYGDIPYQCSSCGLRFSHTSQLNKHLDWHYQKNKEINDRKNKMSTRAPLSTSEGWLKDESQKMSSTTTNDGREQEFIFENYVPSFDVKKYCSACGEMFKDIWDREKETWLLDQAVKVKYEVEDEDGLDTNPTGDRKNYALMHFSCYKLCLENEGK